MNFSQKPSPRPEKMTLGAPVAWGQRLAKGLVALGVGVLLWGSPLQAEASTVYLYDSSGNPVDVTASYIYQQHYVYDSYYNVVGTVDDSGRIFDASMQQIGFVYDPIP